MDPRRAVVSVITALSVLAFTAPAFARGTPGSWSRVGEAGAWKDTIAATTHGGALYTVESSGKLYRTDLGSGSWQGIGKAEFGKTRFLVSVGDALYTIESSGSLYAVDPASGVWKRVGKQGAWLGTIAAVGLGDSLYTVESSGKLYRTDVRLGTWAGLGKADFAKTRHLLATRSGLYSIESSGSLYHIEK